MPKRIRRTLELTETSWPASNSEERLVADLLPSARNARKHGPSQIRQIVRSIERWGWTMPVLVDEGDEIIAGHGRILAAKQMSLRKVPVIVAKGWTESEKRAYGIADNQLTLNSEWDLDTLEAEIEALDNSDFDMSLLGFSDSELAEIQRIDGDPEANNPYTMKVESPVYEPTGTEPSIDELYEDSKMESLIKNIMEAALEKDERAFLLAAATRHVRFDYGKIAEWYCHASAEVQELMEESALVIIDFNKAIEGGFVRVCSRLRDMAGDAVADSILTEEVSGDGDIDEEGEK